MSDKKDYVKSQLIRTYRTGGNQISLGSSIIAPAWAIGAAGNSAGSILRSYNFDKFQKQDLVVKQNHFRLKYGIESYRLENFFNLAS